MKRCRKFAVLAILLGSSAFAEERETAEHRQIWVPHENLETVLKKHPHAVLLQREQYEALVRDAAKSEPDEETKPPASVALQSAEFTGQIVEGVEGVEGAENALKLRAAYQVACLTEEWAEAPIALNLENLASLEVDGKTAIRALKGGAAKLLIRGKGEHRVVADFLIPTHDCPGGKTATVPNPRLPAANLSLQLPDGVQLTANGGVAHRSADADAYTLPFPGNADALKLTWTTPPPPPLHGSAIRQTCRFIHYLDATRVHADLGLRLQAELLELPATLRFALPPNAQVLLAEGSAVRGWTVEDGELQVTRVANADHQLDLRVLLDVPTFAGDEADLAELAVALPMLRARGVFRAEGSLAVVGSDSVRVQEIGTPPQFVAALGQVQPEIAALPQFVTGFQFSALQDAPTVTLRRSEALDHASLLTKIAVRRDAIHLERTLTVQPREGTVFETRISVPDQETGLEAAETPDAAFTTRSSAANALTLRWKNGLTPGQEATATIRSRIDPDGWYGLGATPLTLSFASAEVDCDVLTGYLAIEADPAFRLETTAADGLEKQDGRRTPVKGRLAWSRLSGYGLTVEISRREPEIEAQLVGYALPLANTLEIEGQLNLNVRHAPIRALGLSLPVDVAQRFKVESPLVSEQNLDAAAGDLTLRFHREIEGAESLRWRMSIPFESTEIDGERRFQVAVPAIAAPGAIRLSGHWMIEANTDTELEFSATNLDAADTLRIPVISGYEPQHRVIAAYAFRGAGYGLTIDGVRHQPEPMPSIIIDEMNVDSVLNPGGQDRHQVRIRARSSGDQFLEVGLPPDAQVWTLIVGSEPVKPVASPDSSLRVPLGSADGKAANAADAATRIRLIFETGGDTWRRVGRRNLEVVRLAEDIPVLRSKWRLHVPDGFSYDAFETNLAQEFEEEPATLFGAVWKRVRGGGPIEAGEDSAVELVDESGFDEVTKKRLAMAREAATEAEASAEGGFWLHAATCFRTAHDWIARSDGLEALRRDYLSRSMEATAHVARQKAEEGAFGEAMALAAEVLRPALDPQNAEARSLLRELEEPAKFALTPAHLARLGRIKEALRVADAHVRFEDYELAAEEYAALLFPDTEPVEEAAVRIHQADRRASEFTRNKLRSIILPAIEFENTPVKDALDFLAQKAIELDPAPHAMRGVNFRVEAAQPFSPGDLGFDDPATGGGGFGSEPKSADTRITLRLTNVPLDDALRYVTELALLKYRLENGTVVIGPHSGISEELVVRVFRMPPNFLDDLAAAQPWAPNQAADPFSELNQQAGQNAQVQQRRQAPQKPLTPREYLENMGISFPAGSFAEFDPVTLLLTVRNTPGYLDLADAFVAALEEDLGYAGVGYDPALTQPEEFGIKLKEDVASDPETPGIAGVDFVNEKLKRIIVPDVNFEDMPLAEALEHLRQASVERDDLEPDPARKGVNFVMRVSPSGAGASGLAMGSDLGFDDPASEPKEPHDPAKTRISLKLSNVPLVEAVRYVTELARLKFKVEPHAVVIVPITEVSEPLSSQVFHVPPGFLQSRPGGQGAADTDPFADLGGGGGGGGAVLTPRPTARTALEDAGITFPPGASAVYDPRTSQLIVRNGQSNLDLIEAYVQAQNEAPMPYQAPLLGMSAPSAALSRGRRVAGLRPLDFSLPDAGRTYAFGGSYAPEPLGFRYTTWEGQMRTAWIRILLGAAAFWLLARWRPVYVGLLGVAVLAFLPLSGLGNLSAAANGLLLGWLATMALFLAWRSMKWMERRLG